MNNHIYNKMQSPQDMKQLLERTGIESLLRDAFKKPLTTVIAGAGYGKTQAVLAALKRAEYKYAWIQLSQVDNHTPRFWERIVCACKPCSDNLFGSLISLGYPQSIAAFDQFLRMLTREIINNEHFIIVFDDFHLINNKAILNFIELFISACVQNFSVVIISRTKPDISLTGMMSKGLLAHISENELRFSEDEMNAYFHMRGIDMTEKMSRDIYFYTDGWILAIYLVGLVLKKGGTGNQNPVLAVKIDIFDLIEKEVFSPISAKLRDFLTKISVLEAIPSGLLNELTEDDPYLVSEMISISLIRYDVFSDSFCFHNLFREYLLKKTVRLEDGINKIYLAAAEWFLKNGRKFEAIEYYKKCNLYNKIFDIILSITYQVPEEVADFFVELIGQAPDEIINERQIIRVAAARYMYNNNRIDEARRELLHLRKEFEALPETQENQALLGEVYLLLAFISVVNIDYEFEELLKMADKCLPGGSRLVDNKTSLAEGVNICSIRDSAAGELKRHQDALFNVAPYASRVTNGCCYGLEYLNAAESCIYTGELKSAEKYAYEAIYRSRQYKQYDVEYMSNFVVIRIFTAKGNYAKISELLDQMKNQLENLQISSCISLYDMIKGWVYVKIGRTDKVAKWLKYEEETRKMFPPVVLGREYLVRSDCLLAEERYYELLAFMEQTDRMYESRGILFARIQNKITRAIICHYMSNYDESINVLHEAYELTNPNNLIMQYIEYGAQMRTLIYAARRNKSCEIPKEWLDKIYTKSSTYAKQLAQVVSGYNKAHAEENMNRTGLSKRELEVLTYLCRGLTREEIAESCYLSIGTVNDIFTNIYTKLGASNAADAVRIANEKHLL